MKVADVNPGVRFQDTENSLNACRRKPQSIKMNDTKYFDVEFQ